jgi:hypothetical protein
VMRYSAMASGLLAVALAAMLAGGCGETAEIGELVEKQESVDLGSAETVDVEIEMGMGELSVSGGGGSLMEGSFIYNVIGWDPEISYNVSGGTGYLVVRRGIGHTERLGHGARYEWDLKFDDRVPMNLDIQLGAGSSELRLGSLNLDQLDISTGAGEVRIYLTGRPSVRKLDVETGAGDVTVDLTGRWRDDLDAKIVGGVGRLTLRLPDDVGVAVRAKKGLGKVTARGGLYERDDTYVNDAYGDSGTTLEIECGTGIGSIILEMGEASAAEGVTI